MSYRLEDIIEFVRGETAYKGQMNESTRLNADVRIWGDDHHELIEKYAEKFGVDMSEYLWYFHTREEPFFSPLAFLFKPPNRRVKQIDISIATLLEGAVSGKWPIGYPVHSLPKYRYDVLASYMILVFFVCLMIWAVASREW